jgi:prophage DNA circulation protein
VTWRDELQPASFRGIPFLVESVTRTEHLHADEQVFPGRETAGDAVHVEPLGAGPERFQVDAFVVGPEYPSARDALEHALGEPGPGRLVHPHRGEKVVSIVGQVQTTESRRRGGFARIVFSCVITESPTLRRTPDTAAVVARDLDAFLEGLAADFGEPYDDELPEAVSESSGDLFTDAVDSLSGVYSSVLGGIGEVSDFATDVSQFATDVDRFVAAPFDAVDGLIAALGRIASAPERLLGTVVSIEERGGTVVTSLLAAMRPLIRFGEDLAAIAPTTSNRVSEARNRDATLQVIRGAAIGHTIRAVATLPFDSRSEAIAVRDELVDALDRLVDEGSAGGDTASGADLYEELSDARAAMVEHLSGIARTLPELTSHTLRAALPALVLAHDLYGDARREAELVARNDPAHPGWIPADTVLEVLRG